MRALGCPLAIVVAFLVVSCPPSRAAEAVPGRVIVAFTARSDAGTRAAARRAVDGALVRRLADPSLQVVSVDGPAAAAVRELRGRRGVRFAEPDYVGRVAAVPDDPDYSLQWNMRNIGLESAWNLTTGLPSVKVAVLDTGVDLDHPDLAGRLDTADDYDVVDGDATPDDPADASGDVGHGTHVAGILGAAGNNGTGVAGVTWGAQLIPYRVCRKDGTCTSSAIADGLLRAGRAGARVANLSISGLPNSQTVAAAIAANPGMLIVTAAGNADVGNGADVDAHPTYPCSYPAANVVCVAASGTNDKLTTWSNYGARSVDLAAPGLRIWSTVINDYDYKSGTSMAAPHVAGAAALLWSNAPTATVAQVRQDLLGTVDPESLELVSGGRLNVTTALLALPGVQLDSGPSGLSAAAAATFTWHATPAGTTFSCQLDGQPWGPCSSPWTIGVADGDHTFSVQADTGGVTDARSWTADTTGPAVAITSGPDGPTRSTAGEFAFTVGEGAGAECSLDGGSFSGCASPYAVEGLADGPHRLTVRAFDALGNAGAATRAWVVDTSAPAVEIEKVLPDAGHVRVAFRADPGASTTCALDGGAAVPCASPATFRRVVDGRHTVTVTAADALGNARADAQRFRVPSVARPTGVARDVRRALSGLSRGALARRRPFTVKTRAPAAGTLRVTVRIKRGGTLFSGSRSTKAAGRRITVRVKRSGKAASLLRRRRTLQLQVIARFTPKDGRRTATAKPLSLTVRR